MVVFLLPILFGLWRKDRFAAQRFLAAAVVVSAVFYLFFYFWTVKDHVFFQPLHLLHRERQSGLLPSIVAPLGGLCVLLWALLRMGSSVRSWLLALAALCLALFAPTGLGELTTRWAALENWEGANYVAFGLSLLVTYIALGSGSAADTNKL